MPSSYVELLNRGTTKALDSYTGEHSKELAETFERRDDLLLAYYESGILLDEPYWNDHLNGILQRILNANPEFSNQEIEAFYVIESGVNAAAFGQGVVIINLGLLQAVNSEDEIASVLCHELSHQFLNHANNRIFAATDKKFSKETQQKLKKLKKQVYNVLPELRKLEKDLSFETARHTRYGEHDADSLGLALYLAAGYSSEGPLKVMEVLGKADTALYASPLDFSKLLHTPSYPFKSRWSYKEPPSPFASVQRLTEAERDSLKTHPDTDERAEWLANALSNKKADATPIVEDLESRKRKAAQEIIALNFNYGLLGRSLYSSLRMVETQDSLWAKGIVALSLYRLALAREKRHFSDHIRLPAQRFFDEGYEDLLRIMHAMRLNELKELATAYAKTHASDFSVCGEELALARVLTSTLGDESPADRIRLKTEFKKAFPNSTYTKLLQTKGDPWLSSLTE